MITEQYGVEDFFQEIVKFGAGTFIIGAVQMLMGYIFVTSMNYAAEGQVREKERWFNRYILQSQKKRINLASYFEKLDQSFPVTLLIWGISLHRSINILFSPII